MDGVIRGVVVYVFLLLLLRLTGKRTLGQITTFDFVLLLIISETVQNALVDGDGSMTHAFLLVLTLVVVDLALSTAKQRWPAVDRFVEGLPLVLVRDGRLRREAMDRERVDESEIAEAAREKHGLASLDDVRHAVLERSGEISIVPRDGAAGGERRARRSGGATSPRPTSR